MLVATLVGMLAVGASVSGSVVKGNAKVAEAAVWIEGLKTTTATKKFVIDQKNMKFIPSMLVVPAGSTVQFPNSDCVYHNVFSYYRNKRFDLGMYPAGESKTQTFTTKGICELFCNIHPKMRARIVIVESSVYDVTGKDGSFTLSGVPDGEYKLHVWHDKEAIVSLVVKGGKYAPITVSL